MPFFIVYGDITRMEADAIVNAANGGLAHGGGVCGAIFAAAGADAMEAACARIGHCDVGNAVVTPGFGLKAKYVIHTVGPVWQGGDQNEETLLGSCYRRSLELAGELGCASVAFPLISSGIYGYPRAEALRVAAAAIGAFLLESDIQVTLVVFDADTDMPYSRPFRPVRAYIEEHLAVGRPRKHADAQAAWQQQDSVAKPGAACAYAYMEATAQMQAEAPAPKEVPPSMAKKTSSMSLQRRLKDLLAQADETFSMRLLRLIDEKGMTDVEAYRRANLDRRLFSKIRSDRSYRPSKATALSLAVALRLSLDETRDLLLSAGYALSPASARDLIVEYFISSGSYDIFEINAALFAFRQPTLGDRA